MSAKNTTHKDGRQHEARGTVTNRGPVLGSSSRERGAGLDRLEKASNTFYKTVSDSKSARKKNTWTRKTRDEGTQVQK